MFEPSDSNLDNQTPVARRRLGRGINALLGGAAPSDDDVADLPVAEGELREIPVDDIARNPFQPRRDFDEMPLMELTESVRQHGVLQPLLVRSVDDGWQLVAGERRWLAARRAGLATVPCRVLEVEDRRVCEVAIEENLKRQDLNVLEKAQAFKDYLERFGSSIEELAQRLSLDRSTVSNMLRLLELPDEVQSSLRTGRITAGHARALLPLDDARRIALCRRIEAESLSVRKSEEAVRELLQSSAEGTVPFGPPKKSEPAPAMTAHVQSLQDQLRDLFGAKVEIRLKGKDAGRIIVHFSSNDEFERILRQFRRAAA